MTSKMIADRKIYLSVKLDFLEYFSKFDGMQFKFLMEILKPTYNIDLKCLVWPTTESVFATLF